MTASGGSCRRQGAKHQKARTPLRYSTSVTAWAASLVFVAAYVPLMAKFLPYLLGGRVAIADIYGYLR